MTAPVVLSWIICGLIVGLLARAILPGRQGISLLSTILLGIVGAIVGGFLYSLFQEVAVEPFTLSGNSWQVWAFAILGGVLVLWAYTGLFYRRLSQ